MASNYDTTEFVDTDFQARKAAPAASGFASLSPRAPTREEVDLKVSEAQQKLAELKRAQEELERERAGLEETRRRQREFQTGREEMQHHLARGLELLEKAEFAARRDAEQMKLVIAEFRTAQGNLSVINEETWTRESYGTELSRGLAAVENARMEWNAARLRFPVLSGKAAETAEAAAQPAAAPSILEGRSFGELCKVGLALTWPLAVVATLALGLMVFLLLRGH
jgi:DNA repair exonuclease SbcCD ATPase subunit